MKKYLHYSISIIFLMAIMTSCSIQKRLYTPGYFVQWDKGKTAAIDKNDLTEKFIDQTKIEQIDDNVTTVPENNSSENLYASIDNSIISIVPENNLPKINNSTQKLPKQQKNILLSDSCDNIILKNGDEIKAKVLEIGTDEIKYKKCDNLNGPTISIKKSDVFMIKYANGTKDIITPNNSNPDNNNSNYNSNSKPSEKNTDKKDGTFGIISFCLSIVGLLVAAVILGPIAMIFGIIGMINRKLTGLAVAGFIIGLADLIIGLILIASLI